jgi:hypothetical protein
MFHHSAQPSSLPTHAQHSIHSSKHRGGASGSLGKVVKTMMKLYDYTFVHPHENDVDLVWIQAKDRRETYENNPNTGNVRWHGYFRCRGSRRESAVAQLFSLGSMSVSQNITTTKIED